MLNQVEKTGVNNPFKYAGGYLDASGYYLFGVRYYDPSLGRWTQQDPVGGSLGNLNSGNRYIYVEDDPVNATDLSGEIQVVVDYGINLFGFNIPTAYNIIFSGADITSLQGSGGDYIKFLVGNALSGAGVPAIVQQLILLGITFQGDELAFFSNVFCGGNGVRVFVPVFSPLLTTLNCP